jgi:hypothetical protein
VLDRIVGALSITIDRLFGPHRWGLADENELARGARAADLTYRSHAWRLVQRIDDYARDVHVLAGKRRWTAAVRTVASRSSGLTAAPRLSAAALRSG